MAAYDIATFDCYGHNVKVRYFLEHGGSTTAEIAKPIDYRVLRNAILAPVGTTDEQIVDHICEVAQHAYLTTTVPNWTWLTTVLEHA